jgi:ribosomal protein L37AE/L43A
MSRFKELPYHERDAIQSSRVKRGLCPHCGKPMTVEMGPGIAVWSCGKCAFSKDALRGSVLYRLAKERS